VKKNGFTLTELVVTVGIVGILAAIAYPSYIKYTQRADRNDATRTLTVDAQALERCYSQFFTYIGCVQAPAGTTATAQGYYNININPDKASHYTLTATPLAGPPLNDTSCQTFTLTSGGTQAALDNGGADNTKTCWGSAN
jgi:type IV pilus assembly protein PilE